MLLQTFCHIEGVSEETELKIWQQNIKDWDHFLSAFDSEQFDLPAKKCRTIAAELHFSKSHLEKRNLQYFKQRLPGKEHWRLVPVGRVAYVDIETTGLSKWSDIITVIGVYDEHNGHRWYVKGENLEDAAADIAGFDIIVTFNGKLFDIPFIEHHLPVSCRDHVHLDLRYLLKEFGYRGGLKRIEETLGIAREAAVADIDGREAVRLWNRFCRGGEEAKALLLHYNEEDTKNLKTLLDMYMQWKQEDIHARLQTLRETDC